MGESEWLEIRMLLIRISKKKLIDQSSNLIKLNTGCLYENYNCTKLSLYYKN